MNEQYKISYRNYPALVNLLDMVQNNKKKWKYVMHIIEDYNTVLKLFDNFVDFMEEYLRPLIIKDFIDRVKIDGKMLTEKEKNHLLNYIKARGKYL